MNEQTPEYRLEAYSVPTEFIKYSTLLELLGIHAQGSRANKGQEGRKFSYGLNATAAAMPHNDDISMVYVIGGSNNVNSPSLYDLIMQEEVKCISHKTSTLTPTQAYHRHISSWKIV